MAGVRCGGVAIGGHIDNAILGIKQQHLLLEEASRRLADQGVLSS